MKQFLLSLFLMIAAYAEVTGQTTTITITTGSDWADATLIKSLKSSESAMANTNYNNYPRISSTAWTHTTSLATYRNLLKFDLTTIPVGTTVQSATLQFYSDPANTSGEFSNSGSNSFSLQKVTQAWTASTVTWNNQPTSTTTGRVLVSASASATENISINITALVQGMVNSPTTNYGLLMRLDTETASRSRNYASTDHTNSALHPKLVIVLATPPSISNAWKDGIEAIFKNVNRSYAATGFLADYGIYMTNLEKFNGIPSDSNYIEYDEWQVLYTTLFTCRFNTNSVMTEPSTIYQLADTLAKQNPGTHMIMGMHYRYDRFRDDAVSANLVYVSNNKIYDTPGRTQLPYEQRDAFAVVPDISVLQDANHTFLFKPNLFYTNTGKTISSIQFDAGDGLGYRTLTFNTATNVTYASEGEKTMRFKITYTDNSFRESRTKVLVENITQTNPAARTAGSTEEFNFPLAGFPSPQPFKGKVGKALVTVAYGNTANVIRKPFIVLEGFDPSKITGAENYSFETNSVLNV